MNYEEMILNKNSPSYKVLIYLYRNGLSEMQKSGSKIAYNTSITYSYMVNVLKGLKNLRLLTSHISTYSRRTVTHNLTEKGRKVSKSLLELKELIEGA